jgi:Kef-type K+ transport system membrane component KefB
MFIVGMEFDMEKLKGTANQSLLVSSSSILFPFILGCIFAYFIFDETLPNHPSQFSFVLFVGISMSVTAFPVLIRILGERSMLQTPMGIFVTGVAAMVDVIAWVMLAAITTIVQGHSLISSIYQVTGHYCAIIVFHFCGETLFRKTFFG